MSKAIAAVTQEIRTERLRQITDEDWDAKHDDQHTAGDLAYNAAMLALGDMDEGVEGMWDQWGLCEKHANDRRRQLVIAGALIVAEIERLDRIPLRSEGEEPTPEAE